MSGALDGFRILDLTWGIAGPLATMLMADNGAEVVRVSAPGGDQFAEHPGYRVWNRGKKSLVLDLNQAIGLEVFHRLLPQADALIESFQPGVADRLGIGYETLIQRYPRLVYTSVSGYGQEGSDRDRPGYDGLVQARMGIQEQQPGYREGPIYLGFAMPSYSAAFLTLIGTLTAVLVREQTGRGTEVEIPQCEILDSVFAPEQIAVQHGAPVPSKRANKDDWMAPHNAYRVAGADQWISIAVASDEEFAALTSALRTPELAKDSRFTTVAARKENEQALDAAISDAVKDQDQVALERALQAAGVKACRVVKAFALPEDEGMKHIGFFQPLSREVTGTHLFKTWPFRFSSIDASHKRPPPLLGEHNSEVLTELLDLSEEELARLESDQVIGTAPLGIAG